MTTIPCPTRLDIAPSVYVAPGAVLVGDVSIAAESSIWFQVTVRGDVAPIVIGARSNIQDGSVVHVDRGQPTHIGDRVTLGHGAMVHASEIGDDVLIAMRAVVLSGCRIGRNSLIGAGAVLPEGLQVPEGSLVLGVPGKIVRPLRPDEIDRIHDNAASYVELARAYRDGLVRLPGGGR